MRSALAALAAMLVVVCKASGAFAAMDMPRAKADANAYSAAFVTQSVPSFIELFTETSVSVTMRNTGTATWVQSEGDVFLATQRPQDNFFWCIQTIVTGSTAGTACCCRRMWLRARALSSTSS